MRVPPVAQRSKRAQLARKRGKCLYQFLKARLNRCCSRLLTTLRARVSGLMPLFKVPATSPQPLPPQEDFGGESFGQEFEYG